jgi:uncharacterized protein
MPSLTDRLRALGVQVGTQNLPARPPKQQPNNIEIILPGERELTLFGEAYVIREATPLQDPYGMVPISPRPVPEILSSWSGTQQFGSCAPENYLFVDIETTGLGLGAGIIPFLVGVGVYTGDQFIIHQYFLRDPGEETAALAALSRLVTPESALVTFNGRTFDLPVLNNRYTLNALGSPFPGLPHLDLLPISRRLWRDRLPSRTLLNLEGQILQAQRSQEDIPGWVIPQLYKDYLHTGDARLIKSVFYHNAKDILAMAALLGHMCDLLTEPQEKPETNLLDLVAIGQMYESLNRHKEAVDIYNQALSAGLPPQQEYETLRRLSFLHKHMGNWTRAVETWQTSAEYGHIYACVELAKFYEHRAKNLDEALNWTTRAQILAANPLDHLEWMEELNHRQKRLIRKLGRKTE